MSVVRPPDWQTGYARLLLATDVAVSATALTATAAWGPGRHGVYVEHVGTAVVLLTTTALWVLMLAATGSYDVRYLGAGADEYKRIGEAAVRLVALVAIVLIMTQTAIARSFFGMAAPVLVVATATARWVARKVLHKHRHQGRFTRRVVVVGDAVAETALSSVMSRDPYAGYRVVTAVPWSGTDGASDHVLAALSEWQADTVAVHHSSLAAEDLRRLAWALEGTGVELVVTPALTNIAGPRIHLRPVAGLPLLHVEEPDLAGRRQRVKTVLDRLVAASALVLLTPLFAVVAVLIRLTSKGPVLFRQERLGKDACPFSILKFRTMYDGADERFLQLVSAHESNPGGMFVKERQDPRVTPVGRWLRRFSIDELPQLVNVARGEMSLVGPRPLPIQVAQQGEEVRRRLLVKPGMTGLWQVSGRSNLSFEEAVRMDLYYVENWSLSFDLMILWRTVRAVATGGGAY